MPDILERCVTKLKNQGKKEDSAYAICTASLKKAGKLGNIEEFIDSLESLSDEEFDEVLTYAEENAVELWSAPTKRKDIPSSHFFDPKNKKYPYRNPDGSVNCGGVMAAWKMAHGARSGKKASSSIVSRIKPYHDRCMNKSSKEKKQSEIHHSLAFPISFPEDVDLAQTKPVNIQILKKGKFRHPWYGILNFNEGFFDSMMSNFEADIPMSEISFDFIHQPDLGAAAWVLNLFKDNDAFMATVELTDKGREAIKNKRFRYFSSSYTDDYVEYAFEDEVDENGNVVSKEFKISHGPTLLGGGLTNRPFIKGMKPVSLSEDGSHVVELEEVVDVTQESKKEVDEEMKKKLKDLESERDTLQAKVTELQAKEDENSKKELKDINEKLENVLAAITKAEEDEAEKSRKKEERKLEDVEKDLEEAQKKIKKLEEVDAENKELSDKVNNLTTTVNKLLKDKEVMAKEKHQVNMKDAVRELKEMGVFPSSLEIIEGILLSESSNGVEIKLSEGEGDDKKEVSKNLAEVFKEIFEAVPVEFRFTEDETTESVTTPTGKTTNLTEEDVEKFAKDNNLEYEDALIELDKQGKL